MNPAGLLSVRARFADGALDGLSVQLVRPPIARMFVGQSPEVVVKAIPYLYTLCAHAQRAAAQAALAGAMGEARRPVDEGELWIEFLHENFWRLLLDWPNALGLPPANAAFIAWRSARQGERRVEETQKLIAGVLRPLAEKCLAKLVDRGMPHPAGFPALNPEVWLAYWKGTVAEAPPLAVPAGIGAALQQRLHHVDLAAAALAAGTPYPAALAGGKGWGVGQTLTSRGVLTHAVHVDEDRVGSYRVSAPTDRHFADATELAALLAGHRFADAGEARAALELAILALDPCLPYTLELENA